MKSFARASVACLLLLGPVPTALAAENSLGLMPSVVGASELFISHARSGLALEGYDPLTYLLENKPRVGSPEQELVWSGLSWRFASAANRAAFLRDPDSFAPRIGGYDAEGAAKGILVESDPRLWVLRSGRIYLFRSAAARERFQAQQEASDEAEARWPSLRAGLVSR